MDEHIAKPDGDPGFLSVVEQEGQDYGYVNLKVSKEGLFYDISHCYKK